MPYKIFHVSLRDPSLGESELNAFLANHRVLAVDRRWVEQGPDSFWAFCIDYVSEPSHGVSSPKRGPRHRGRDYKEVLSPDQFAQYAKLRELRKEIAQTEAVPIYTVFTNEQLAQMVQTRVTNKADIARIEGVGEARIEKYADRFIELLSKAETLLSPEQKSNEADGTSA